MKAGARRQLGRGVSADLQVDGGLAQIWCSGTCFCAPGGAGGKRPPIPNSPNGDRDQSPTGKDKLNRRIRSERPEHAGESHYPMGTG